MQDRNRAKKRARAIDLLTALSDKTMISWNFETVSNLHRAAKYADGCDKNRQSSETRLIYILEEILSTPVKMSKNKLVMSANSSACGRLESMKRWFDDQDFNMFSMKLDDAADHLEVCRALDLGKSAPEIEAMILRMDTASRDWLQMDNIIWEWIEQQKSRR